jgi:hypothetical protein
MSNLSLRETESGSDDSGHIPDGLRPTPRKPPKPTPRRPEVHQDSAELDTIHQLLLNPALFDPLRTPRYPIVLTHGAVPSAPTGEAY